MQTRQILSAIFFVLLFSSTAYAKLGIKEFLSLCENGTQQQVEDAIRGGADVNARNKDGWTALMLAAGRVHHDSKVIASLVNAGADVNAKTQDGGTALMLAAKYHDHPEGVAVLINAGADVNEKTQDGKSALMFAVDSGSHAVAIALINAGADVNAKTQDGVTALKFAVYKRAKQLAVMLINAGADVNARDKYGSTALQGAANNLELTTILLKAGADVNASDKDGWTALMNAAHPSGVELLTRARVTVDASAAVITMLINAGADINAKNVHGHTALMHAMLDKRLKLITTLIDAGSDVNARDKDGMTVLMRAAQNNSSEVVAALIKAGADVNAKTQDGKTALTIARQINNSAKIAVLIKAGAEERASIKIEKIDINQLLTRDLSPKEKASIEAAIRNLLNLQESAVFIDWGYRVLTSGLDATVTIQNGPSIENWEFKLKEDGKLTLASSPLWKRNTAISLPEICKTGNYEEIKAAIDSGANLYAKDKNGDTVLHIAARRNFDLKTLELFFPPGHCIFIDEARQAADIYKKNKGKRESITFLEKHVSDCTAGHDGDG